MRQTGWKTEIESGHKDKTERDEGGGGIRVPCKMTFILC
jgi:hypothetical protein